MPPIERPSRFNMMLSLDEEKMLDAVATRRGLTASDLLRQYIRQLHEADSRKLDPRQRAIVAVLTSGPRDDEGLARKLLELDLGPKGDIKTAADSLFREGYVDRDARGRIALTERGRTLI